MTPFWLIPVLLLAAATALTMIAARWYANFATRSGIIAHVTPRGSHDRVVPRGGGITFGTVFSVASVAAWATGRVPATLVVAIGVGGAGATLAGFLDDVYDMRASTKLVIQACLGAYLVWTLYEPFFAPLLRTVDVPWLPILLLVAWFVPLWLINMYNFIDGVDGMAILGAVFVCVAAAIMLLLTNGSRELLFTFALLGASGLGFVPFNLPPARIFMGDAGSIFFGYVFAALVLVSAATRQISVWTWLVMLSYFVGDTTTTTLSRIALVKTWYGVHRSHAYQNLARVTRSHAKVTYGVALYHFLWALPLAVWSVLMPRWAPLAAVAALTPAVLLTLRFGPRFSTD